MLSLALLWGAGCTESPAVVGPRPEPPLVEVPGWPEISDLHQLAPLTPPRWRRVKVLVDAGHGAENNAGNTGVLCQSEADEMRRVTDAVVERLRSARLSVESTRPTEALVSYDARLAKANSWSDLLISLHSDVRSADGIVAHPKTGCRSADGGHGFSVLWSDEGPTRLSERRHELAVAIAEQLIRAGFVAYGGEDYGDLYAADPVVPGVFVDRHEPRQRIRLLRRPRVPSVIVETHNALDEDEVARWSEEGTLEAFASALRAAVVAFSTPAP